MKFLIDTNVVSEIRKPSPEPAVAQWYDSVPEDDLFLSVAVLAEIAQGIEALRQRSSERARLFDQWLAGLSRAYADRIIDVDRDIADTWGRLNGAALALGQAPQLVDNLLAATAMNQGLAIATRNVRDFAELPVSIFNPWHEVTD
ncbi:MAG: type II toxin-antitoxin system VapC family toxin [Alphaproteobacteria bacterium]